ncbi:MAG TPA: MFS transporter [Stellaceae bacterium]|jgi:MFS family permease
MTAATATPALRGDIRVVGLVAAAHFMSHFYQLLLPPIFPLLVGVFGVGYADLGLVVSVTYVVSGLMQTPAGILVDRLGPARVLIGGLAIYSASVFLSGLAPSVWWLVPLMAMAGLGNCVFHPADYAIMTARVRPTRLGRAFGAHTLAGNFGWVAAPVAVLALTQGFGWRAALMVLGAAGAVFTLYLASQARLLAIETIPHHTGTAARSRNLLISAPILFCFGYFALLSASQVALQNFLPSAAMAAFSISIEAANLVLTIFLFGSSVGTLFGAVIADRLPRQEATVAIGLSLAAALSLALALAALPLSAVMGLAAIAGLGIGVTIPARDMLVRGAAPEGATGRVFGFVYSGLDLGAAVTPFFIGQLLDRGLPRLVFVVAAAALIVAIMSAVVVTKPRARRKQLA